MYNNLLSYAMNRYKDVLFKLQAASLIITFTAFRNCVITHFNNGKQ